MVTIALHGAGGSRDHWDDVARLTSLEALDLPGRGAGAPVAHVDAMLDAVLAMLDARGIDRAVWVGHSMGGIVSQRAAVRAPERVGGLVLLSTTPLFRVPEATFDAIAADFDAFARGFARSVFPKEAPEELKARATEVLRRVGPETLAADLRTAMSYDGREALASMAVPTIVVVGDRDRLTPPSGAEAIARGVEGAELRTLAGAGHMLTYERPDAIADAIASLHARLS